MRAVTVAAAGRAVRPAAASACLSLLAPSPDDPARCVRPRTLPVGARGVMALGTGVPAARDPGSATAGGTVGVKPRDVRIDAGNAINRTATVAASDLTTGSGPPAVAIGERRPSHWSGPLTAKSGPGNFTAGQATTAEARSPAARRLAYTRSGASAVNPITWNPTVIVNVPSNATPGTRTRTVAHSVV